MSYRPKLEKKKFQPVTDSLKDKQINKGASLLKKQYKNLVKTVAGEIYIPGGLR